MPSQSVQDAEPLSNIYINPKPYLAPVQHRLCQLHICGSVPRRQCSAVCICRVPACSLSTPEVMACLAALR